MKVNTYKIETAMGRICEYFGHPLHFLSDKEKADLDTIGYTGKLGGVKMSRESYLNSLGKGTFNITQTKFDDGSFSEEFIISRAEL